MESRYCYHCDGTGEINGETCPFCLGTGFIDNEDDEENDEE